LTGRGLPPAALVAEARARTTVENLSFGTDLVAAERWLVVTDDVHAVRAAYVAERLGLAAEFGGVETRGGRTGYVVREVAATVAYRLGAFR
jgi:uncharacterized SAM-binding protein YcdF (DUF218 family)